jgi:hypothetical protein
MPGHTPRRVLVRRRDTVLVLVPEQHSKVKADEQQGYHSLLAVILKQVVHAFKPYDHLPVVVWHCSTA